MKSIETTEGQVVAVSRKHAKVTITTWLPKWTLKVWLFKKQLANISQSPRFGENLKKWKMMRRCWQTISKCSILSKDASKTPVSRKC